MNRVTLLPDMLHCTDMTVLERQQERQSRFSEPSQLISEGHDRGLMTGQVKPDPVLENGWPDLGKTLVPAATGYGFGPCGPGFEGSYVISRTSSCPPEAVALNDNMSASVGRESFKKRKADKVKKTKIGAEEVTRDKRLKGSAKEGDSKITEQNNKSNSNNRETSANTSKASEVQKPDYIHVRARRGQATDSHSLAERVRREKISERMKHLQDLVPGCNKITGKAGMLDEIINYVQSLQRQVEFLSMKLAAVNPRLDNFFAKEAFLSSPSSFGMSSEMTNPVYLQFNSLQEVVTSSGLEMGSDLSDMGLMRTISAPVPETFLGSSCCPQLQPSSNWDPDLQNFYHVASFPPQPFTGSIEASNPNIEM